MAQCNCKICKDIRAHKDNPIDWEEIKKEFFSELTDYPANSGRNIGIRTVKMGNIEVFNWFKSKIEKQTKEK